MSCLKEKNSCIRYIDGCNPIAPPPGIKKTKQQHNIILNKHVSYANLNFMDTIKVVCGLIYDKGKVLICRRKPEKTLGEFWEFPGGKVEQGESYKDCLKRELHEELGMSVKILKHFKTVHHNYGKFNIELISFVCNFKSCSYEMIDHDMYEWMHPVDLLKWELAPADIPIAEVLISEGLV